MNYDITLLEKIKIELPEDVLSVETSTLMPHILVKSSSVKKIIERLKFGRDYDMKFLNCISASHIAEEKDGAVCYSFNLIYILSDSSLMKSIAVKVLLDDKGDGSIENKVPSIDSIYHSANWFEREIYDLHGIFFDFNRDLSRLLLPPDWDGHPLRKDYSEKEEYNGISTTREDELINLRPFQ